ncbi:phosphatidylinositol kinase, partial [Micromonospora sp. WMMD736]
MTPTASEGDDCEALRRGELTVIGRIRSASNATFLCEADLGGQQTHCVYKPIKGEAPLWDFPDGTLAGRELAAYLVSTALGWNIVPYT